MRKDFMDQLEERYRRRGYALYGVESGLPNVPDGWRGPYPDLYAEKSSRKYVFLNRSSAELLNPDECDRILEMLENPGVVIRVFVFSSKALKAAYKLRKMAGWLWQRRRIQPVLVQRRERRVYENVNFHFRSSLALQLKIFVIAIFVGLLLFIFFYVRSEFFSYSIVLDPERKFQPRDAQKYFQQQNKVRPLTPKERRQIEMKKWQGLPLYE